MHSNFWQVFLAPFVDFRFSLSLLAYLTFTFVPSEVPSEVFVFTYLRTFETPLSTLFEGSQDGQRSHGMESHRLRGVTLLRRLRRYLRMRYVCSLSLELFPCTFSRRKHEPAVRSVLRVPVNFRSNGFSAAFRESRSFRAIRLIFPFLETHYFAQRQIVSPNKNFSEAQKQTNTKVKRLRVSWISPTAAFFGDRLRRL